jgi:hypothetical protein
MSVAVVWLVAGIPALAVALAMFVTRSRRRALLGYLALAVGFAIVTSVDRISGSILGLAIALLYAAGRGGRDEDVSVLVDDTVPEVTRRIARRRATGHVGRRSA